MIGLAGACGFVCLLFAPDHFWAILGASLLGTAAIATGIERVGKEDED